MTAVNEKLSWRNETGRLFKLAGPLIVNNLGIAGMNMADTIMSGRLGATTLAAVAVGASVWFFAFTICMGLLMAISPIAARHWGAGQPGKIGRYTRQGIYLALLFSVPVILAAQHLVDPLLASIGIDPAFRTLTVGYVGAISWGAPGIFVFLALRFTTEGVGLTKPIMFTSMLALVCNVFLNWVFMFGKLGAPALGAVGCGFASALTMWLIGIVLFVYMAIAKPYRPLAIFERLAPPRIEVFREIVIIGVPIAVMITAEAGLFNAVSLLMGTRGAEIAAAHQVAISYAMTMFMIPLALSSAITIRVGHELGAGQLHRARYAGAFGIIVCTLFMTISAAILFVFRTPIVTLYTDDPIVQGIAVSLLFMAAIFQIADGIQVGAAGALRGYKDTRVPMVINTFAYWALGFPLAYIAAVRLQLAPEYIWAGFVIGLGSAAMLLSLRYFRLSRRTLQSQAMLAREPA